MAFHVRMNVMDIQFDWDEVDALITLLDAQGVSYLLGNGSSFNRDDADIDAVQLIQRLAACGYPLVENASISLFLLHPDLASAIIDALRQSNEPIAEQIAVLTLATLYLQQWWIFRLTCAFGHLSQFPVAPFHALWEERGLPAPNAGSGLHGLFALQEYQQQRTGLPLNFLEDWQNQINHLLTQEEAHHRELPEDVRVVLRGISLQEGLSV